MKIQKGAEILRSSACQNILIVLCCGLILFSCSPSASDQIGTSPSLQIAPPVTHAQEIRIGLVGKPTDVNVWALFDEEGTSYANYALRWEYWPRLYTLSIPELKFTPLAAEGQPSTVIRSSEFYVATVNMREDLTWSDGQPLTAEDAAFTINTVLAFELGFDWKAFYDPNYLDRVESEGASTLRYYFKNAPNIGVWQYGALQGPIVNKTYWEPKIQEALQRLSASSFDQQILEAEAGKTTLEKEVDELNNRIRNIQQIGGQDRQLDAALKRAQANLDAANNTLSKLKAERREEFIQARIALYSLDDNGEPTLGNWIPQGGNKEEWINALNPNFPFLHPHFDIASYSIFDDEQSAIYALQANDVDLILRPRGLSAGAITQLEGEPTVRLMKNPSRTIWFLIFNPSIPVLSNPALRQAVACMLANESLSQPGLQQYSFDRFFTADSNWQTQSNMDGCSSLTDSDRLHTAIGVLKKAGYTWRVEPKPEIKGEDIAVQGGEKLSQLTILAVESDPLAGETANLVKELLLQLGVPATTSLIDVSELNFAVFSSGNYDLAILSWNLSTYPSYLCDWFTGPRAFQSAGQELEAECASLEAETDLDEARAIIQKIQDILYQDSQLIPIMTELRFDAYRNITFPFENIVEGLSGVFGAPSLALPAP